MVRIKFTARPRTLIVSPKFSLMASDETPEISAQPGETSADQLEESLVDQQVMTSTEAALTRGTESNRESQSRYSRDIETASDYSGLLKVASATTLARISYDFGQSSVTMTRLTSMENYTRYFPKGYSQPPGVASVPEPRVNETIVFEDFFAARLRMPPHPVLVDILCKFWVQLHDLTPNAIVQISKFIWAVTSCGGWPTADVFTRHY
jgi:hypothetical protein